MISKELLGEVLLTVKKINYIDTSYGVKVVAWKGISVEGNECTGSINIYELAYKCKEWAYTTGITCFLSGQSDYGRKCEFYRGFDEHAFTADTEPEAIFKACEWIRTQIAS